MIVQSAQPRSPYKVLATILLVTFWFGVTGFLTALAVNWFMPYLFLLAAGMPANMAGGNSPRFDVGSGIFPAAASGFLFSGFLLRPARIRGKLQAALWGGMIGCVALFIYHNVLVFTFPGGLLNDGLSTAIVGYIGLFVLEMLCAGLPVVAVGAASGLLLWLVAGRLRDH